MNMRFLRAKKEKEHRTDTKYEDGLLFIDCGSCASAPSMGDAGCVKCVSGMIGDNGTPSRLIMRRDSDTEYSDDVIMILNDISKIGSLTKTAYSEKLPVRCKECSSSIPKNAEIIWNSFPEPRFDIIRLEAERSVPNKEGCEEFLWRTVGFIDRMETMFSDLKKKAAKKAFRLTEV